MQTKIFALFAVAGLAAAQLSAVPQCALGCAAQAAVASGCDLTDYKCQCTTGQQKSIESLTPCVCKSTCSKEDQAKLVTALNNLCASAVPGYKPVAADPNACGGGASSSSAAPASSSSEAASSSAPASSSSEAASSSAAASSTEAVSSSAAASTSAAASSSSAEASSSAPASSSAEATGSASATGTAPATSSSGTTTNGAGFLGVDTALMGIAGLAAFAL